MNPRWLEIAKRLQAIAQAGLTYTDNKYDIERFEELRKISVEILSDYTGLEAEKITDLFTNETGYQTPKVDVRAVVFQDRRILMVRETIDGCWSLPGGWADVGYTPGEVAAKEVWEEAGLEVRPVRLLAVLDKKCHPHPPAPYHIYKVFILCEITGGSKAAGMETSDVEFFERDELPELSRGRITEGQIKTMFEFLDDPQKQAVFD